MAMQVASPNAKISSFSIGDTVNLAVILREEGKTRKQRFEGIVIAIKGQGVSRTFTVRKIARGGLGIERIFPLHSPNLASLKVIKKGKVRRSKLYYLRGRSGRAAMQV